MATKRTMSDLKLLEKCRITIENLQQQPEIAATMAQFGYDSAEINMGKALFDSARAAYDNHEQHKNLLKRKYQQFLEVKSELQKLYRVHRMKAKLIFKNDQVVQPQLLLTGNLPRNYIPWLETVRTFYKVLSENPELANSLLRLKVTPEEIQEGHTLIATLEEHRSAYYQATAETQLSTHTKEQALNSLQQWISTLKATAKIAFMDQKGLLLAMGR
ncbi:MAG: hypothetical protein CVU04_00480 [Bacteroidetes bacterium HGW-Bacteroidetes-20]|nr:MAG: hypothetical protein CVU04_00480 [Bacteroidetes bacterium HGW-Bacteroidetes-20]